MCLYMHLDIELHYVYQGERMLIAPVHILYGFTDRRIRMYLLLYLKTER